MCILSLIHISKVKVVKNKVAPPFKEAEFDIMYGKGISKEGEILDFAVKYDIIEKSGSWFAYEGNKLGQGRDNVKEILKQNPELMEQIEEQIKEIIHASDKDKADDKSNAENERPAPSGSSPKAISEKKVSLNISADDFEDDE